MPRNGSGQMSAPGSYPPAAGSVISLADYKALVDDIVAEMTDSLSRSGKGGMTSPLRLPEGAAAAPSLAFTAETNTGIFKPAGASELRAAIAGTLRAKLSASGLDVTGALTATGDATVGGTLGVTGVATLGGLGGTVVDGATVELNSNKLRVKDLGIATAKLAAGAVTRAKQAAVGQQISAAGSLLTSTGAWQDVPNLTVTITTTGRPVLVLAQPSTPGNAGYLGAWTSGATDPLAYFRFLRDASEISQWMFGTVAEAGDVMPTPPSLIFLDTPAAGEHVYKLQAKSGQVTNWAAYAQNVQLVAFEL